MLHSYFRSARSAVRGALRLGWAAGTGGTVLRALGLSALGVACAGCPAPQHPPAQVLNVIAVDRSGSTEAMRDVQKRVLTSAFFRAANYNEEVAAYTVDREASCVFAPQKLRPGQRVSDYVLEKLKTPSQSASRRTRPARFWTDMAAQYATPSPSRMVRILYLSDGGDDYSEGKEITRAAAALAANPSVLVGLLGVVPSQARTLQQQFASFGEKRLILRIGNDLSAQMEGLSALRTQETGP